MINLETRRFETLVSQAHQVAVDVFRPNSRRYDTAEHEYPKELDMLAALIDGMTESGAMGGAGVGTVGGGGSSSRGDPDGNCNGANMASLLGLIELCWGDVGLMLSMPRQGLGQAAIAAVATPEQLERFGGKGPRWRSPSPRPARTRRRSARPLASTATRRARRLQDLRHVG